MRSEKSLRAKFASQKNQAKSRGIEWMLTFDEWITWWGDDIENRGIGSGCLQMQRFADAGPYAIGNIKKGYPKDNSATYGRVIRNRRQEKKAIEHQRFLDALMFASSKEYPEDYGNIYQTEAESNGVSVKSAFVIDK